MANANASRGAKPTHLTLARASPVPLSPGYVISPTILPCALSLSRSRHLLQPTQQPLPRLQNAARLMRQHLRGTNAKTTPPAIPISPTKASRLLHTTRLLLWGGGSLTLGLGVRSWWAGRGAIAHCEGSRLAVRQEPEEELEDQKFDWLRLWSYLEPHLWELIGAVCVSILCQLAPCPN